MDTLNTQYTPIVPLIIAGNTEEAIRIINQGIFDISEHSEGGRNLLALALSLGRYNIADRLIQFSQENNIHFPIYEKIEGFKTTDCVYDVIFDKPLLNGLCHFIVKHNLSFEQFDFASYCRIINFNKFDEDDYHFTLFRKICSLNKDHIKKLDPINTIISLGKIGNKKLIKMYYEICDFDKLPINEHPSFKLLKDVCINSPKYSDHHTCYINELFSHNINENKIKRLSSLINDIQDDYSFRLAFNYKNKGILEQLSHIFKNNNKHLYIDSLIPYHEYQHVFNILSSFVGNQLNQIPLNEQHRHFKKRYLTEWPTFYFKNKSYAQINKYIDLELGKENETNIKNIINQFNLIGLSFAKDIKPQEIIIILNRFASEIKEIFPIQDNNLANQQLWINFFSHSQFPHNLPIEEEGSLSIRYFKDKMFLNVYYHAYDHEKTLSTLIHEYTHFMQFNSQTAENFSNTELLKLQKESYKWVDFSKEDFSHYFLVQVCDKWEDLSDLIQENNLFLINKITSLLDKPWEKFGEELIKSAQFMFSKDEYPDTENRFNEKVMHYLPLVKIYQESQQQQQFSYEYYLWKKNRKNERYLNNPIEIHARFNQALHGQITNSDAIELAINPKKLEAMKSMIKSFNHTYLNIFQDNIKKKVKI